MPEALWSAPGATGERINVIARRRSGKPPLEIYFHVDTVPPGDGWSYPPLRLTTVGDRHFGRGTADMKGTIACVLACLRAADATGLQLAYDPVLLFCTDEEGGLYPGIRWLAEQGKLDGHLLNLNGGAVPRQWAGCFGSLDLRLTLIGRAAHSGDPGTGINAGINAIEESVPVLQALLALKRSVGARRSAMPAPPHFDGRPLTARLSITAAEAGTKGSALPGRFEVVLNRRYAPEEDAEAVLAELRATIEAAVRASGLIDHRLEVVGHLAPVSDPAGPHWPRWRRALAEGFGWSPDDFSAYGSSTSSDMGWVQHAGIQEILLGGLSRPERNVHGADEHTTDADLKGLARSVLCYLSRDFGTQPDLAAPNQL